jgi:hypothetical protein
MESKKRSMGASERDEQARSAWRKRVRLLDPKRLVFVEECGTNVALAPLYARALKGQRAFGKAPRNWDKNITLIASLSAEGIGATMSFEGATDALAFETYYVEHFLTPSLQEGQIVVMDNLQVHKSSQVRDLIERAGASVSCSYRLTQRTSHPSKKPSRRLRPSNAGSQLAATKLYWKRWVGDSMRLAVGMLWDGSSTAATTLPIVCYENRSRATPPTACSSVYSTSYPFRTRSSLYIERIQRGPLV